jgi:hypothetical protein
MRDAQDAGDDRDGSAQGNTDRDPGFGEAVGKDHQRGDKQKPVQATRKKIAHEVASVDCGGLMPISVSAEWHRAHTFFQMP